MKASLDAAAVKAAMTTARIVKPITKDFSVSLTGGLMRVWSFDRRRSATGIVRLTLDSDSEAVGVDEEFFLPEDRAALFDSDLSNMTISTGPKGMTIKFEGDGKSRSASVKRRSDSSKRPKMTGSPDSSSFSRVPASTFEDVLRQVSCSALVRETKTDEDMRINQIHFYADPDAPGSAYVTSNARFYATVVKVGYLGIDFSMVSSDIPAARAFCSRASGDVLVGVEGNAVRIVDPVTGSWVAFAKVQGDRPALSIPDGSCKTSITVQREDFRKAVKWCSMALEGTQRLTFSASGETLRMNSGSSELSAMPGTLVGSGFATDIPVKVLSTISDHLADGLVHFGFGNPSLPDVVQVSQDDAAVSSIHFVRGMKVR